MRKKVVIGTSIGIFVLLGVLIFWFFWRSNDVSPVSLKPEGIHFERLASVNFGTIQDLAYDAKTYRLLAFSEDAQNIQVISLKSPTRPIVEGVISRIGDNSVAQAIGVNDDYFALAFGNTQDSTTRVVLLDTDDMDNIKIMYDLGKGPVKDLDFSPDGKFLVGTLAGAYDPVKLEDPLGKVFVIDLEVQEIFYLDFTPFDQGSEFLLAKGMRSYQHTTALKDSPYFAISKDVEPDAIDVSHDSKTAWVSLQASNALAQIDLINKAVLKVMPLGVKDFKGLPPKKSDRLKKFGSLPLKSFFQPDDIKLVRVNNFNYIITANEGVTRKYGTFEEVTPLKNLKLDPKQFPQAKTLQASTWGSLEVSNREGDFDQDGDFDALYVFGGRSFGVWSEDGTLLYDSGNMLRQLSESIREYAVGRFYAKGVEPETLEVFKTNGINYLAVGLERSGDVMIFNINNPAHPVFLQLLPNTSPSDMVFIPKDKSPNGRTLLVVANEYPDNAKIRIYALESISRHKNSH